MKKEKFNIYDLIWAIRHIVRYLNCTPNGAIVGDLMTDAITFYKMENGESKLWHINKSCTWIADDESQFQENLYRVSKEDDLYTIEKIK